MVSAWREHGEFRGDRLELNRTVTSEQDIRSMTRKNDETLQRIEVFNEARGGGVAIRKAARGYSLFREDNGKPVARLRTTAKGDLVEVMCWSHRGKWEQIGDFGPMVMPLEEALEYVAKGSDGLLLALTRRPGTFGRAQQTTDRKTSRSRRSGLAGRVSRPGRHA